MTDGDDEYVHDEDLLIEAARYAIRKRQNLELFMSLAKRCWYKAATERGLDPQTLKRMKEASK